jgi:hypothetical protein
MSTHGSWRSYISIGVTEYIISRFRSAKPESGQLRIAMTYLTCREIANDMTGVFDEKLPDLLLHHPNRAQQHPTLVESRSHGSHSNPDTTKRRGPRAN